MDSILGWTATLIFNSMYVPQIFKSISSGSVKDVSIGLFWTAFIGNIIALIYATKIHQAPLIFKYSVDLVSVSTYLVIYYKLRGKRASNI